MNTSEVAAQLGTTPKALRRFLRSPESTFVAVGSGARYDFTSADVAAMRPRFTAWQRGCTRPTDVVVPLPAPVRLPVRTSITQRDQEVWDEEGPVEIADIRLPNVRRRVRQIAEYQEARLNELLLAAGLHISQRAG